MYFINNYLASLYVLRKSEENRSINKEKALKSTGLAIINIVLSAVFSVAATVVFASLWIEVPWEFIPD